MAKRKIIEIDREKCNGCGLCTTACAEGALVLDQEKKAVLVKEIFCDGMGACLDVCPVGALKIVERESKDYDPKAAYDHVLKSRGAEAARHVHGADAKPPHPTIHAGCPGAMARELKPREAPRSKKSSEDISSELSQWPIQLHLISPQAPYFNGCDLLIAADCTAFTLGNFHPELLRGKKLVIACPKLDDTEGYVEKIAELIKINTIYSLTVAIMEVPCCSGLFRIVQDAVELSGAKLAIKRIVIGIDGNLRDS